MDCRPTHQELDTVNLTKTHLLNLYETNVEFPCYVDTRAFPTSLLKDIFAYPDSQVFDSRLDYHPVVIKLAWDFYGELQTMLTW